MISLEANEKTLREKDMALQPVPLNTTPDETYFRKSRLWQGIPGIERTYGGRFWRCFFSGGNDEGPDNYVAVEISDDACDTWSEPIVVIDPPGNVRAFDPCLWRTPSNELFLFWAQSYGGFDGRAGCWYSVCRDPDEAPNVWTEPRRIADGVMLNKPTVLMNGEWALPITLWGHVKSSLNPNVPNCLAKMYVSSDQGKTFEYRGGVDMPNRWFDESMILEKNDGTLQMLTRRKDGIGEAFSHDGGRTGGKIGKFCLGGPNSRFHIRKLHSGHILLINHWSPDNRFDTPRGDDPDYMARNNLAAFLSVDDGKTWSAPLLLDERELVSYPDAVQTPDDQIYIIYDRERNVEKELLLARITEEDILRGKLVSDGSFLRKIISKLN